MAEISKKRLEMLIKCLRELRLELQAQEDDTEKTTYWIGYLTAKSEDELGEK